MQGEIIDVVSLGNAIKKARTLDMKDAEIYNLVIGKLVENIVREEYEMYDDIGIDIAIEHVSCKNEGLVRVKIIESGDTSNYSIASLYAASNRLGEFLDVICNANTVDEADRVLADKDYLKIRKFMLYETVEDGLGLGLRGLAEYCRELILVAYKAKFNLMIRYMCKDIIDKYCPNDEENLREFNSKMLREFVLNTRE